MYLFWRFVGRPCAPYIRSSCSCQRSQIDILDKLRDGNSDCVGGVDPQRVRQRSLEKCLQLLNDCQPNILSKRRLRRSLRLVSSTKPIFRGFWTTTQSESKRGRNRDGQTADRLDCGLRREAVHYRKRPRSRGAKRTNECQRTPTKGPCGRPGRRKHCVLDFEGKATIEQTADGKA